MPSIDAITQAELADVLHLFLFTTRRICVDVSPCLETAKSPEEAAASIFRIVREKRDHEYEDGAVYVDAYGEYWLFDDALESWFAFGAEDVSAFHVPKRPLRKMAPEPEESP